MIVVRMIVVLLGLWSASLQAATILVWGDSLSAGYGIKISEAWPSLLQTRLQQSGYAHQVVNGSVSGETTAGGRTRLSEALARHKPSIVILELGANDGLRGLPVAQMRENLTAMIQSIRGAGANVLLVGMQMPPNLGPVYTKAFNETYAQLASTQKVAWVPFLFEGFADDAAQFQADGLHPNAQAQGRILETIWKGLSPLLGKA